jgi:type II secretory pathway pseudopilin PulG
MNEQSFQIIFEGKIQEGKDLSQVKQRLAELFRLSEGGIEKLFCGKTLVVRRNLSEQEALKYQQAFEKAGAICQAVREEPEPSEEATKEEVYPFREEPAPSEEAAKEEVYPSEEEIPPVQEEIQPAQEEVRLLQKEPGASLEQQVSSEPEEEPVQRPNFPPCPNCGYRAVSQDDPLITGRNGLGECPACGIIVEEFFRKAQHPVTPDVQEKRQPLIQPQIQPKPRRARGGNIVAIVVIVVFAVTMFLGIIAAIAVPNLLTAIQRSKRSRTIADMRAIATALGSFQVDYDHYPNQPTEAVLSNEILPAPYYAGTFQDAWETSFRYVSDGKSYKLTSYGKDKKEGDGHSEFDADIIHSDGRFIAPEFLVDR